MNRDLLNMNVAFNMWFGCGLTKGSHGFWKRKKIGRNRLGTDNGHLKSKK